MLSRLSLVSLKVMFLMGITPAFAQPMTTTFELAAESISATQMASQRVISTSNVITQVVVALGEEPTLVGIDLTSQLSDSLKKLPSVGYRLALSTEGILSLNPSLIILFEGSGPKNVLEQIQASKIAQIIVPELNSLDDILAMTRQVSHALKVDKKGERLAHKIETEAKELEELLTPPKRYQGFFIMQEMESKGSLTIAGRDTGAQKMLDLLAVDNLFAKDFSNYKSVSLEGQFSKTPDVVLIGTRQNYNVADRVLFSLRQEKMAGWPTPLQPKCVFDVSISDYLVYGIHIYDIAYQLRSAIDQCIKEVGNE